MKKQKRNFVCGRVDPEDGRRKKCFWEKNGKCDNGYTLAAGASESCSGFQFPEKRSRYNGSPAVEPNPPTTPEERLDRWRSIIDTFGESTGIPMGRPPQAVYQLINAESCGLMPDDFNIPPPGRPRKAFGDEENWIGCDPSLLAVLQSDEFIEAAGVLPLMGPGVPGYKDRKAAEAAWTRLRDAARNVVECSEEVEARHRAGCGLQNWKTDTEGGRLRWASAWIDIHPDVEAAAKVLADATIPNVKVVNGRPSEGKTDGLSAVIAVLQRIRCPDGRELTIPELTWLLMLALPGKFLYEDELKLRQKVQNYCYR